MSNSIYYLDNLTNATNFVEMTQEVNIITGGWFGFLTLVSFFIILFAAFRGQPPATRVTTAAFITTLVSFLFRVIGMTSDFFVLLFVIITSGSFIAMYYSSK